MEQDSIKPTTLTFKEYQGLSIRTLAPLTSYNEDLAHMALGMTSELNKLMGAINRKDRINMGEELADICWYVSGFIYFIRQSDSNFEVNYRFNNQITTTKDNAKRMNGLFYDISVVCDMVKKFIAYKKEYDLTELRVKFIRILKYINYLAASYNIDMEEQLDKNIRKLKVRFPDKFNIEDANNRNLDDELNELET